MSKKNRKLQASSYSPSALNSAGQVEEYRIIKGDLLKVLVINVLFLAGVLILYFTNVKTHYLETWFDKIIRF
jgi:hypothetical protein